MLAIWSDDHSHAGVRIWSEGRTCTTSQVDSPTQSEGRGAGTCNHEVPLYYQDLLYYTLLYTLIYSTILYYTLLYSTILYSSRPSNPHPTFYCFKIMDILCIFVTKNQIFVWFSLSPVSVFSPMHAHFMLAMFWCNQVSCETHEDTWQTREIHISETHSWD